MIERVFRHRISPELMPMSTDITIPFPPPAQTGILGILSVVARWGSLLTAAALAAVVMGSAPPELMLTATPAILADRSFVSYWRIRRS
ncbi:hypothetical protein [Streptomyces sp. NPDC091371]|uniref:hypothetical protein n=1 Tax=Streptomyces sp. NPDC091371 TaxID=3155303 RepID=UPI00342E9494